MSLLCFSLASIGPLYHLHNQLNYSWQVWFPDDPIDTLLFQHCFFLNFHMIYIVICSDINKSSISLYLDLVYRIVVSYHSWTTVINNINAWFRDKFVTETRQATVEPSLNLVIKKVEGCFITYELMVLVSSAAW